MDPKIIKEAIYRAEQRIIAANEANDKELLQYWRGRADSLKIIRKAIEPCNGKTCRECDIGCFDWLFPDAPPVLPDSITEISPDAFKGCPKIDNLVFPEIPEKYLR